MFDLIANPVPHAIEAAKNARLSFESHQLKALTQLMVDNYLSSGPPVEMTRIDLAWFTDQIRQMVRDLGLEHSWHFDVRIDWVLNKINVSFEYAPDPGWCDLMAQMRASEEKAADLDRRLAEIASLATGGPLV